MAGGFQQNYGRPSKRLVSDHPRTNVFKIEGDKAPRAEFKSIAIQGNRTWSGRRRMTGLLGLIVCLAPLSTSVRAQGLAVTRWEKVPPNEGELIQTLVSDLSKLVQSNTSQGKYRALRDAHPRGIGCVEARFSVDTRLEKRFQTGVFAKPGQSYDAIIRFSSSLGPAGDQIPDARGMAIKIFGVPGQKLLDSQKDALTHDFLQIDAPIFPTVDAEDFAGLVKVRLQPASLVGFLSKRTFQRLKALKAVNDLTNGNPHRGRSLADRAYFSQVPYLLQGPEVNTPIKFASKPCQESQQPPSVKLDGSSAELRHELQDRLSQGDLCFDFGIQLYKDNVGFKIEDGTSLWAESISPFIKVAKIIIKKQNFVTDQKLGYCDSLSFQPWHALSQHRPLGGINRVRKAVYEAITTLRHEMNRESDLINEPRDLQVWKTLTSKTYELWKAVDIPAAEKN